jgi:hypothetical protein
MWHSVKMLFIIFQLKVQRVMYSPQLALRDSLAARRLYLVFLRLGRLGVSWGSVGGSFGVGW